MKLLVTLFLCMLTLFASAVYANETPHTYVVRSGDTLSAIAHAHKRTVDALMEMNKSTIANRDRIYPKQVLVLQTTEQQHTAQLKPAKPASEVSMLTVTQSTQHPSCNKEAALKRMGYPQVVEALFVESLRPQKNSPSEEGIVSVAVHEGTEYVFAIDRNCVRTKIVRTANSSLPTARIDRDDKVPESDTVSNDDTRVAMQAGVSPDHVHDARKKIRKFLFNAIGPPWNTKPIEEGMLKRQFGI